MNTSFAITSSGQVVLRDAVINPSTTENEFLRTSVGQLSKLARSLPQLRQFHAEYLEGGDVYRISVSSDLEGAILMLGIAYYHSRDEVYDYSDEFQQELLNRYSSLLHSQLGSPPYKYAWGEIAALRDPKIETARISVLFRPTDPIGAS
jgi:hypothetical protein